MIISGMMVSGMMVSGMDSNIEVMRECFMISLKRLNNNPILFISRSSSVNDTSYAKQFSSGKQLFKVLPVEDLVTERPLDIWVLRQVSNVTCSSPTISVFLSNSGRIEELI